MGGRHADGDSGGAGQARRAQQLRGGLRNGQDYFKIRHAWLEVTLADGRRVGSRLAADTYTQPPGWTYLEGTAVPFGESITFELWFDLEA